MVAVNQPAGQLQAFRTRVTKLDSNGVPTPGAASSYVSSALVSLAVSHVYKDGDHLEQVNGAGDICVEFDGDDSLLRCDFTLVICKPDPYLQAITCTGSKAISATGLPTTEGHAGSPADANRPYGWATAAIGPISRQRVSIEVFTKRIDNGELMDDYPFAWWVLPSTSKHRLDTVTLGNNVLAPSISGKAFENEHWFDGPTENWPTSSDRVIQWIPCKESEVPAADDQYVTVAAS